MTVLDASVLVSALTGFDGHGDWAESVCSAGDGAAPEFALVEVTNSLRRLERRGEVSGPVADIAARDLLRMQISLFRFAPFAGRVWEMRHRLTAYDACYVALAESLHCGLATLDRRLARTGSEFCEVVCPAPPGVTAG